jgi:hypothetical protein
MLKWLTENATSEIVILCSVVLGVRQSLIRTQIEDLRKEVLSELLDTHQTVIADEDDDGYRLTLRQNPTQPQLSQFLLYVAEADAFPGCPGHREHAPARPPRGAAGLCCVPQHRRSRLAHEPLNPIENQPYPPDHRDRNHAKIKGLEQAGAHQCKRCLDRAPFGLCMRMPKLILARRTSSRSFWRSRYSFAMPASGDLSPLLVGF